MIAATEMQAPPTMLHSAVLAMQACGVASKRVGRVQFSTSEYEFAHGHRPHGFGPWAFDVERSSFDIEKLRAVIDAMNQHRPHAGCGSVEDVDGVIRVWMPAGKFSDCKAAVARILAAFCRGTVRVCT